MTSFALSLGCALLAFSPTLSLLFLFAYSKAQLIIIVISSAFSQLLACLLAAILHLPFQALGISGGNDAGAGTTLSSVMVVIPTSIVSQMIMRCGFVRLYHKVEHVIEKSIQRHEMQHEQENEHSNSNNDDDEQLSETAQLRLELNDASASIAAGVGFGFFHTVMLYGTLLASENSRMGTLYQDSCTMMPSIFNSALMAFMFGIMDIVWMCFTFYGMRMLQAQGDAGRGLSSWHLGRDAIGGKVALLLVLLTHFAAALATVPNQSMKINGCVVALPSLAGVMVVTVALFWVLCKKNFLPSSQELRIRQARSSSHLD